MSGTVSQNYAEATDLYVKKIHFKSNGLCYVQNDVKFAVILANLRLKESEPVLIKENPKVKLLNEDYNLNAKCQMILPWVSKNVTYRMQEIESVVFLN